MFSLFSSKLEHNTYWTERWQAISEFSLLTEEEITVFLGFVSPCIIHVPTVNQRPATEIDKLLMMGMRMPETC
jgi:hypothetical protein